MTLVHQLMAAKLISFSSIYHPGSVNAKCPLCPSDWGNTIHKGPCTLLSSQIQRRGTHCSLATSAQDVKTLLLPTLKVPSSFSQYVSQDGGPHIRTLLIVPSLHHIPLYLLFFQVIYISLALITVQPRFLQADSNLAISGANGSQFY